MDIKRNIIHIFIFCIVFFIISQCLFKKRDDANTITYMRWALPAERKATVDLIKKFQKKYPKIKITKSPDEIFHNPDVEAVVIAVPASLHFVYARQALQCKKHVLVEKPVVTDFNDLRVIQQKANEKNILIFPGHNFLYRGAVFKAKEIIESGKLGKIVYSSFISSHYLRESHIQGWRSKKELGTGGALMDSGHHMIYQSLYPL